MNGHYWSRATGGGGGAMILPFISKTYMYTAGGQISLDF